ncbi:transferase 2, rSAM/selenodomain-associated [Marinobacter daqiaonensis]|uniref:Transferase 2, rSAM/selenodomain-associated n=1 Tax=Marinobacter daqiaonensis TaxID=650891 RepID=A0A1I6JIJ6_9GAMM|nr:TIGR04283 family arsenosugar biosynthesis glycosyltransferase [Marinobacter daqiaonensis]SFR78450.1 transferase 2, rSAM/selenodomain-associated [Marinobacter daqiaonensis]
MHLSPAISIVIPVLNEASTIAQTLAGLSTLRAQGVEVIVVDGGSEDDTAALAGPLCDRVTISEPGRARQMNAGAALARGDILLFLHADTRLPHEAGEALDRFVSSDRQWGRFDVRLSGRRAIFRVIETLMSLRSRLTGIATGDQAIFVRRSLFENMGGFPEIPLMEDVELCGRLRRVSRPFCIQYPVVTDSRRWERHGPWRTIGLMWRLRWQYWRGADPRELVKAYRSDVRGTGNLKERP